MTWEGLTPPYSTIVADPPWKVERVIRAGGRRARTTSVPYSFLEDEEVTALPVAAIAAKDCHLWLWLTARRHREGLGVTVAEAWGFRPVGEIIWDKPNLGMGAFPRMCHEVVLVCRRGSIDFGARDVRSVQRWPQVYATNGGKTHSTKPPAFFDLVERVSPAPYVELFSRSPRLGWDSWGLGYENTSAAEAVRE